MSSLTKKKLKISKISNNDSCSRISSIDEMRNKLKDRKILKAKRKIARNTCKNGSAISQKASINWVSSNKGIVIYEKENKTQDDSSSEDEFGDENSHISDINNKQKKCIVPRTSTQLSNSSNPTLPPRKSTLNSTYEIIPSPINKSTPINPKSLSLDDTYNLKKTINDRSLLVEKSQTNQNKSHISITSDHSLTGNGSVIDLVTPKKVILTTPKPINSVTQSNRKPQQQSKVKVVPNFAKIHQKAYEKMEAISDYKKRKAERAQFLLSGQKPKSIRTSGQKPKKQLRFHEDVKTPERPNDFIPLPNTPYSLNPASNTLHKLTPVLNTTTQGFIPTPTKPVKLITERQSKFIICLPNDETVTDGHEKKSTKPALMPVCFGLYQHSDNANKESEYTRFGFKVMSQRDYTKQRIIEAFKTIASKNARVTSKNDCVDKKREIIKGVRSNRRFDLLMKMRRQNN